MTISTEFLIYVALYRLTVLTVGALSIYLGFRLFTRTGEDQQGQSEAGMPENKAWKVRFTLTYFWPGTFLALFGTGLIGVMLWQGAPQLTLEDIRETAVQDALVKKDAEGQGNYILDIGRCAEHTLSPEAQERLNREWKNLKQPGLTLEEASVHLGHIARIWQQQGRMGEALAMAQLAYQYGPESSKAVNLSLYAELLEATGSMQEAVAAHQELVGLDGTEGGAAATGE